MQITISEVCVETEAYAHLLAVANQLNQARYIYAHTTDVEDSILLGAFTQTQCVGFLRFLIQVIGRDQHRPPIIDRAGQPLREGYVEAFGVLPPYRRQGIGQMLQEYMITYCRNHHYYQVRSRSPITSAENYALKLKMGYAVHPSDENDSYYFIKTL